MTNGNKNAFKQLFIMIILTLLIQIMNLFKTSIIASNFGATVEMDAFNFVNSISTFIFSFIGTGITTVLIPAIINKKDNKTINNFITILYFSSILLVFLVYFNRSLVISVFSGQPNYFIKTASEIMLITLLSQLFNTILGVYNAVFQCKERFNLPKLITLITTTLLAILVVTHNGLSIYQYTIYIFIIAFLNVIVQGILAHKLGFRYKIIIDIKDQELKKMIKIFIPTIFSSGLYQISLLVDSMIASRIGEGQISILTYSNTLMSMIDMLLISNIITYIYPKITLNINKKEGQSQLFNYIIFFNAIMCLIVIGFIIVGREGITILYERGKFDVNIKNVVYMCTLIYMVALPINVMRDLIYRYFYARGNTKTTFINSIIVSIVNICISVILSKFISLYGIILGTVIASVFSLISILIRMKKQYGIKINKEYFVKENLKIILSSIITVMLITFIKKILSIKGDITIIIFYGFLTIIVYCIFLFCFKSKIRKIEL